MASSFDYEIISLRNEILGLKSYYSRKSGTFTTKQYTGTVSITLTSQSVSNNLADESVLLLITPDEPNNRPLISGSLNISSNQGDRSWSLAYLPYQSLWGINIIFMTTRQSDLDTLNNGGSLTFTAEYTITTTAQCSIREL